MTDYEKFEPIPDARFQTMYIDGAEWLVARAGRSWFVLPFLCVWLALWTVGGISAFGQLLEGEIQLFLAIWLIGWAIGWIFAAGWLGWQLGGRVQIAVSGPALLYRWSMPFLSRVKRYDVQQVRNVRAGVQQSLWGGGMFHANYPPFFPGVPGSVQFDYGGRTVNAMPGLDQAEGQAIADFLSARLPKIR